MNQELRTDKDLTRILKLYEIIKRYELLVEYFLTNWKPTLREETIRELLEKYDGSISKVARELGFSRNAIDRFIRRHGIDLEKYRKETRKKEYVGV